jgi:hypothetical protein
MRFPRIFRRNDRWARQVDAYVDHRLTPVERELLEVRVEESESVGELLRNTQRLKSALGEMPEFEAPRSFALTPAMVAEPAPKPSRGPAVTMRLAQATSFAAIAAFGIVFAFDTVGTTSDGDDGGANMASLETAANGDDMRTTAGDDDSADSAAGTMAGESTDDGASPPLAEPAGDSDSQTEEYSPVSSLEAPRSATEASPRSLLPVYSALGAVFVLAIAAWAVSRHQVQRAQRI